MPHNSKLFWAYTLPICGLLVGLRYYLVGQVGFPDYDSVKNWEVVQQVSAGDFHDLFHHRSPGFFILFSLFQPFITDFHQYIYINGLFNVAALVVFVRFCQKQFQLTGLEAAAALLLVGSGLFLTYSARYFTTESISLLIFVLAAKTYFKRFVQHSGKYLLQTLAWVAFGLLFNYKFLLLLPVAFVLEIWFRDGVLTLKTSGWAILILLSPYIIFGVFSVLVGLPFYRFPAAYAGMVNFTAENAAHRSGKFRNDFFYYFQYLFQFESPLVWLGVFFFPIVFRQQLFKGFNVYVFLFWLGLAFLGGMSLLLKAPRGLLFVYPIFYFLGYLAIRRIITNQLILWAVLTGILGLQVSKINREIYSFAHTSYPEIARFLKQQNIKKIVSTVSLNLKPFLPPDVAYAVLMDEKELPALKKQGYQYVLVDDYYRVNNILKFNTLEKQKPLIAVPEKTLESPLLFLEHSEFTGLDFNQTLEVRRQAIKDTVGLRIVAIPEGGI